MTSLLPLTLLLMVAGIFAMSRARTSPRAKWLGLILMAAAIIAALTQVVQMVRDHGGSDRSTVSGRR